MKRILLLTMTLLILAGISSLSAQLAGTAIFDAGSTWKYLDDGSNQTPAWYQVEYDDAAWAEGPAPLGFGSIGPDIATTVSFGPDEDNKYTTTYFRTKFNYTLTGEEVNYIFNFIVDDGAVFYLNGEECARFNMPEGDIKFTDFSVEYGPENWGEWLVVDKEFIVDGENVLCAEVHQGDLTSSDLGFDMEIVVNTGDIIPANTYFVKSPYDDAEEDYMEDGEMDLGSSDLELIMDGSHHQMVGIRFSNLVVEKGETINSASIQFTSKENNPDPATLTIYGEKIADSPIFDTAAYNISTRTKTDASVAWAVPAWTPDLAGEDQKTPDLSAIVQEIVDLDGWASGNHITFIIIGDAGSDRNTYAKFGGASATLNAVAAGTSVKSVGEKLISVYPNPAKNVFYINNPTSERFNFKVRSITGQTLRVGNQLSGERVAVQMSQSGLYIVEIECADKTYTQKVIMR